MRFIKMGRIDILVNNAGVYKASPLVDYTADDFDHVMQVNVYGAFHVMQLVLRHMMENHYGRIVNIASTAGKWASLNQGVYNASKHALVGLTRCAALESAKHGVTVNAICPGLVETDMLEQFRTHADILGVTFDDVKAAGRARIAQGEFLQPNDIAALALFLASDSSARMTGQSIPLDGGMLFT
ncbi:MAG: SDR family oxidoreductase [Pseudomonadota bacterium]